ADEEGVGARTPREARRLRVEEEQPARIPGRRRGARHGGEGIERRRERRRQRLAAMDVRQRVLAPHDEERPRARLDQLAPKHLVGGGRGGARRPPRLDAPDHAAKLVERLHHRPSADEGAKQRLGRRFVDSRVATAPGSAGGVSPSHEPTSRMSQRRKIGARWCSRYVTARSPSISSSREALTRASASGVTVSQAAVVCISCCGSSTSPEPTFSSVPILIFLKPTTFSATSTSPCSARYTG